MNFAVGAQEMFGSPPNMAFGRRGRVGASEIIGQLQSVAAGLSPQERSQLSEAILGRNAVMVREREWDKSRMYILGFTFLGVAAGATASLVSNPQWPFRPYRIIVPSSIAPSVLINDVAVGQQSAFAAVGAVPAEAFTEVAWGTHVLLDTASPGVQISMSVQNISGAPLDIRAMVLGDAARD